MEMSCNSQSCGVSPAVFRSAAELLVAEAAFAVEKILFSLVLASLFDASRLLLSRTYCLFRYRFSSMFRTIFTISVSPKDELFQMGSLSTQTDSLIEHPESIYRILQKSKHESVPENKDDGDSEEDEEDDVDDDQDGDDEEEYGGEGDPSGEENDNDDNENDDPEANGEGGSDEDDDEGDEDDDDEDDESDEEDEEEDEEEELLQPPTKKRK